MKRIPIIIFLTALIIGLLLLFDKCSCDKPTKPDKEQVTQSKKVLSIVDGHYQNAIILFQKRSDSLLSELSQTQYKLKVVKLKLEQSKSDVLKFVGKDTSGESAEQKLNDCDSLKEEILDYVFLVDSTHQNYENNILQMCNLLAIKDSQLFICGDSYSQLKNIADENLLREQKLTEDLNTAYKEQRKKRIQNKVLASGFLILSGITTTLFINSKK